MNRAARRLRGWKLLLTAAIVMVAVAVVRTQVIDSVTVTSDSMEPTVCRGDTTILTRSHGAADVSRDDIVTFPSPTDGELTIKRVVATAGQRVAIKDAQLEIDGVAVDEPYVDRATIDGVYFGPVTVPAGTVFVMGDNRERSIDSRAYGPIPVSEVSGRLLWRLFSACEDQAGAS
jgi:signal peptidase I